MTKTNRDRAIAELLTRAAEMGKAQIDEAVVESAWLDFGDFAAYVQQSDIRGTNRLIDEANQRFQSHAPPTVRRGHGPADSGVSCPRCTAALKAADLLVVRNGAHRDILADCPVCGHKWRVRRDVGYYAEEDRLS